jgi:hypothetical protein
MRPGLPRSKYSKADDLSTGSVRVSAILEETAEGDTNKNTSQKNINRETNRKNKRKKKMQVSSLPLPCYTFSMSEKHGNDSLNAEGWIGGKACH